MVINQVPKLQTAVKRGRGGGRKGEQGEAASGNSGSETVMSSGSQTRESEATAGNELEKEPSAAQLAPAA